MKKLLTLLLLLSIVETSFGQMTKNLVCRDLIKGLEKSKSWMTNDFELAVWKYIQLRDRLLSRKRIELHYSMYCSGEDTIIQINERLDVSGKDKIWNIYNVKGRWKTAILSLGVGCNDNYLYEINVTHAKYSLRDDH
ncbi:MAG: hypothetical protein FVQ77_14975 [Cytophagales bacterium]|nr:hypothetical protein [Cytophagales bacterium]